MTISNIKKLDLITQLYARLGENSPQNFWPESEVILAINEALYLLASVGNYWKDSINIATEANKSFYNIQSPDNQNSEVIANSITVGNLLTSINFCLKDNLDLEYIKPLVVNRINTYLLITEIQATKRDYDLNPAPANRLQLNERFLDSIRVSFKTLEGVYYLLDKDNEYSIGSFNRNYKADLDRPKYYSIFLGNPSEIALYPNPIDKGILEVIGIEGVSLEDIENENFILPIFNNLWFYLKYGVLADILIKDGENQNVNRAAYCENRWQEGLQIGKNYSSILLASINGRDADLDTISNLDSFDYNWQNKTGFPFQLGVINQNLIAVNRKNNHVEGDMGFTAVGINLDIIKNAPVLAEYIQVNSEYINYVLDYSFHCLMFKCGAFELKETNQLKDNLIKVGLGHNDRFRASNISYESIVGITKKEDMYKSRGT